MTLEVTLSGESNHTGFIIFGNKLGIKTKTKDYKKVPAVANITTGLIVSIICLVSGFLFLFFESRYAITYRIIAYFCYIVLVGYTIKPISLGVYDQFLGSKRCQDRKEWHAAEHKVIHLLESSACSEEITLARLKKNSMFSDRCGSNNGCLAKPSEEKLKEALRTGHIFNKRLEKHNEIADFFGLL